MKILSVNAGSSSLKFTLFELPEEKELVNGVFEKIGIPGGIYTIKFNGEKIKKEENLPNHEVAVEILIKELIANKVIESLDEIDAIGHRLVHGGDKYQESTLITTELMKDAEELAPLAPLHIPANIVGINAFKKSLPNIPMVAVFDTAFHQTMEKEEYMYAVPYEWYTNYGVRKYGFHGTSHRYINKKISEHLKRNDLKVISCHLGNGSSIAAINSGKVVDTTMGFTPLAGVIMGTRSGDIDPGIIPYIMKKENKTIDEIMDDLNKKSGFLGVSGISSDSRDIEDASAAGNERCQLLQAMSAQKVANYIAMYNNILNGADVICFTAGLGENSILTRKAVIEKIKSLGVVLDEEANNVRGEFRLISTKESKITVYIVPTNEELMIATDTYELVK